MASATSSPTPGIPLPFRTITDVQAFPSWRSDVAAVQLLATSPRLRWTEQGPEGSITFEVAEFSPPAKLVSRIADADLPFGGTWTYDLRGAGGETTLTITERGEVYNPVYRFVSRFVLGHRATIDRYLSDLERALGRGG